MQDVQCRFVEILVGNQQVGDPPIDITDQIRAVVPEAEPRMLARIPDELGAWACLGLLCTHEGCNLLTGDEIWGIADEPIFDATSWMLECPCHGSEFDVRTGLVGSGPAFRPLPFFATRIDGDRLLVAIAPLDSA